MEAECLNFTLAYILKSWVVLWGFFLRGLDIWFRVSQKMSKWNFPEKIPICHCYFFLTNFMIWFQVICQNSGFFWKKFTEFNIFLHNSYIFWNSLISRWMVSTTLLWTNCAIPLQAFLCCIDSSLIWIENFLMETKHVITQSCYSHFFDKNHSFQKQQRKLTTIANEPCKIISPPQWWQEEFKTALNGLLYGHNGTWDNYSSLRSPLRLYYLFLFKDLGSISFHSG